MAGSLTEVFRYNRWANRQIIAACSSLTDEQLDAPAVGTHGSIRETLTHIAHGQLSLLGRLDGRALPESGPRIDWPGWDALAELADSTSDALVSAAESLDRDAVVVLGYGGKRYEYPQSFFLVHAIAHGIEHRAQISVMLAQMGVTPPDLDGWPYATFAGFGTEV